MMQKQIRVKRYQPDTDSYTERTYDVPLKPRATVLEALQYIYEELDPSLAFRYGCRYKRCGLCGVMVDGKPRLACKVDLEIVSELAPLANLPILRDLAVDRSRYMQTFSGLFLYPVGSRHEPLGQLFEKPLHKTLMSCSECLCCVATCPKYNFSTPGFAGPYLFVKLAQLQLDERDTYDRLQQAKEWGISHCEGCLMCSCPNGIPLQKAITALLEAEVPKD